VRPAVPLICQVIDEHRERFGVVPVCRALSAHGIQIAPRTYWARQASGPSKRALWDMTVTEILAGIYEPDVNGRHPPEWMYGTVKMWGYLQRQGIEVAKCTLERLKGAHGWRGVTRARRPPRTTVADPGATRAPDLVRRQSRASRPGELVVADFTYVPMDTSRFGDTAFVADAFAGFIPGWECSLSKKTAFVEAAIRQAARIPGQAEITAAWVCWYNTSRLMHRLGLRPPAEAEAQYHQQHAEPHRVRHTSNEECIEPGSVHWDPLVRSGPVKCRSCSPGSVMGLLRGSATRRAAPASFFADVAFLGAVGRDRALGPRSAGDMGDNRLPPLVLSGAERRTL